jgi:hypothetical protein
MPLNFVVTLVFKRNRQNHKNDLSNWILAAFFELKKITEKSLNVSCITPSIMTNMLRLHGLSLHDELVRTKSLEQRLAASVAKFPQMRFNEPLTWLTQAEKSANELRSID